MDEESNVGLNVITAEEAVADAIQVSIAKNLKIHLLNQIYFPVENKSLQDIVILGTESKCQRSSTEAIDFLNWRYPNLFDSMTILTSYDDPKHSHQLKNGYKYHTYFLVKSKDGTWYASSPANHEPGKGESPLTKIFSSQNLQEVLDDIQVTDGGEWPNAEFIKQALRSSYVSPKNYTNNLGFLYIDIFNISFKEGIPCAQMTPYPAYL